MIKPLQAEQIVLTFYDKNLRLFDSWHEAWHQQTCINFILKFKLPLYSQQFSAQFSQ